MVGTEHLERSIGPTAAGRGAQRGAFFGDDGPGQTEELWILDVDGTRLVLVKLDSPSAPVEDVVERDAIFDSIRIER